MTEFAHTICIDFALTTKYGMGNSFGAVLCPLPLCMGKRSAKRDWNLVFVVRPSLPRPSCAPPLREAVATVNLGSTTRAEIFQLGREGVRQRRERRVVKMTVPYAFLALSPPLPGNSAANTTR